MKYATLILPACLLLLTLYEPAAAAKKTELPELDKVQQKYVDKTAPAARKKFLKLAEQADGADKELLARWFPEFKDTVGEPGQADPPPAREPSKLREKLAKLWTGLAEDAQKAGMPATAGWEAYRAHKLAATDKDAARILAYVERPKGEDYVHPRVAKLLNEGKHLWSWGWTNQVPQPLDRDVKPTGDEGDEAHASWGKARELEYTFVKLRSNLPLKEACEIGQRVDALLETMRARYCLVEG
ncbi:MAG: hypothetical protein KDB82_17200, partial [Planctomycetes bacterium]|nr:hypothetical protein [Planctomycetota bacterium]